MLIDQGLTPEGLAFALDKLNVNVRYNVRSDMPQMQRLSMWKDVNDRNAMALRFDIAAKFVVRGKDGMIRADWGKNKFYDCLDALYTDREIDPFRQWLSELEPIELDAGEIEDRMLGVDCIFEDLFETPSTPYFRFCSRQIMLSAVWRAFQPGYKIDEIVVLQGGQGVGKDSVIREMLPASHYFTDALSFSASDKEKIEITRGKVIVCASELSGVTTSRDLEALKRWITSTHDRVRMAYRRNAEDLPRIFVCAGTTNSDTPLPADATGNRRWLVVPIPMGAHVEPFMAANRIRYWQECVALYRLGVRPNLPRELMVMQKIENENLKKRDDQIEDAIDIAYEAGTMKDSGSYQLRDVAYNIGLCETKADWVRSPKQDQHRLRDCLIGRGWVARKRKVNGIVRKFWEKEIAENS